MNPGVLCSVRGSGMDWTVSALGSWIQWCCPGWSYRARQPEEAFFPLLFCTDNLKYKPSCLCLIIQTLWWLIPPFCVMNLDRPFLKLKINMFYEYSFLSADEGDAYLFFSYSYLFILIFLLCHRCAKEPVPYFVLWFAHLYVVLLLCNIKISSLSLFVHIYKCRIYIYK